MEHKDFGMYSRTIWCFSKPRQRKPDTPCMYHRPEHVSTLGFRLNLEMLSPCLKAKFQHPFQSGIVNFSPKHQQSMTPPLSPTWLRWVDGGQLGVHMNQSYEEDAFLLFWKASWNWMNHASGFHSSVLHPRYHEFWKHCLKAFIFVYKALQLSPHPSGLKLYASLSPVYSVHQQLIHIPQSRILKKGWVGVLSVIPLLKYNLRKVGYRLSDFCPGYWLEEFKQQQHNTLEKS